MPPPPIPVPLPPWGRAVVWIAETVATGLLLEQFDYQAEMSPTSGAVNDPDAQTWRKFTFTIADTVSGETADRQTWSVDIANITGGGIDSSWNDSDYATVWAQLVRLVTGTLPYMPARLQYLEARAYIRAFNPYSNVKPFADSGPPEKIYPLTNVGTGGGGGANQVCSTVTELTAAPGHWGRIYTPSVTAGLTTTGRFSTASVDALATLWHDVYDDLMAAEFFPVVPTTQADKVPKRTLQTVHGIQVDDVPDVQRSRRLSTVLYRKKLPLAAATKPAEDEPAA